MACFPPDGLRRVVVTCWEASAVLQIHGTAIIRAVISDQGAQQTRAAALCGARTVTGARSKDMRPIMGKERMGVA
jgi:hypothetical protein